MIKKQRVSAILTLKLSVLLGVAVAFCITGESLGFENFDSYAKDTLISGIGSWATTTYPAIVSDVQSVSAPHSAYFLYSSRRYAKLNIGTGSERLEFDVFLTACPSGSPLNFYFRDISEDYIGWFESAGIVGGGCQIKGRKSDASETIGTTTLNAWHTFIFEQETIAELDYIRYSIDDGVSFTTWLPAILSKRDIRQFWSVFVNFGNEGYVDNILGEPAELRVWGVSPASGSTATSTDADFIIGWEGWDFEDIYKDFVFSFWEKNTGILTGTVIYEPTIESGTHTLNFSDFGIEKNGDYYFHAKARSYLYEYTAYYTGDLVSPEWWINIEVEGWEEIFEMPVFENWYGTHSKFATSTAIFTGITTFLTPFFNRIGEFGDRVVEFLDLNEAYDRGYDLGKIIPTFRHYVSGIEVFFGGFPIIQIFLASLVILLGMFIIRLILSFKP